MHQFAAAFFALLFSFGHASSVRQSDAFVPPPEAPSYIAPAPTRQDLARNPTGTSYPESACTSCRRMNVSYTTR